MQCDNEDDFSLIWKSLHLTWRLGGNKDESKDDSDDDDYGESGCIMVNCGLFWRIMVSFGG